MNIGDEIIIIKEDGGSPRAKIGMIGTIMKKKNNIDVCVMFPLGFDGHNGVMYGIRDDNPIPDNRGYWVLISQCQLNDSYKDVKTKYPDLYKAGYR